jgi:membrane peptidoglycan carboxypeptidase
MSTRSISSSPPPVIFDVYAAGKTGTTDSANDAWFVGFTNEATIAVEYLHSKRSIRD